MQYAGVGAGGNNGTISRILRTMATELVQQLGVQMVFAYVLAFAQHARRQLHRADMGASADLRGAAHGVEFRRVLDQAHLVEQAAQVALLRRHQRTEANPGTQTTQPAVDTRLQPLVGAKRIPDDIAAIHQPRQLHIEFGHREGRIHAQALRCIKGAQSVTVPDLALQVLGLAKQRGLAIAGDHQPGLRLREAAEVIEIAVVAVKVVTVPVARVLGCGGNNRDAVRAELARKACASLLMDRLRHCWLLRIQGPG